MFPLLFRLGPIPIHSYGFLIAIGFLIAVYSIRRLSLNSGLNVEKTVDLTFWSLLVGFLGSRILFVITQIDFFLENPSSIFKVWEGGLVFLGGPIAVLPFAVWFFRKYKLPAWKTADVMVPGLAVAHAFGRLGCVASGCCYGRPTGSDWGFRFQSELVDSSLWNVPLHPVQLYESVALFILFGGLIWAFRRKQFDGQIALIYFMAYPAIRSITETFRGDIVRGFVIENILSTSQFISLFIFIGALALLIFRLRGIENEH